MTVYLDTSAAAKLVLSEPESAPLTALVRARQRTDRIVSSWLLHAELHCAVARRPEELNLDTVRAVLSVIALADVERDDLIAGPTLPGRLRAGDAIHLATALRIEADAIVSYNAELTAAAEAVGLTVLSPT